MRIVGGMGRGHWIWLMLGLVVTAVTGRAAPALPPLSRPEVRREIVAIVEKQLNAFRADDWDGAYACASTLFRVHVPRRSFETLIRRHYPLVWRNARFDVGLPRDDGERAVVPVRVFAADHASAAYDYMLVKETAGWRVSGVVPQQAEQESM